MTPTPKKWARTAATVRARIRIGNSDLLDGLDIEFVDGEGTTVRTFRLDYSVPTQPDLSDVMTALATVAMTRAHLAVQPDTYRFEDDASMVSVRTVNAGSS